MNAIYEKLTQRSGLYNLPYLIELKSKDDDYIIRYINDSKDCTYNGNLYKAGAFAYKPNLSDKGFDGGGTLEITKDNLVIDLVESKNEVFLNVVGVMLSQNELTEIKTFKHHYGKVSITRGRVSFTFEKDDRLSMTFPTLIWSNINNRGNA